MTGGANPNAWNNWYHGVGSTHGTWICGDPRGFRTYHHSVHVDGDYRNPPPPGVFAPLFEHVKGQLKHPPVILSTEQRLLACSALIGRLKQVGAEPLVLAVMFNHFHLLARFPALSVDALKKFEKTTLQDGRDPAPRHFLGLARKHASFELSSAGIKPEGPVWALRPKFDPIRDRQHQINVFQYIWNHLYQGAAVWTFKHDLIAPTAKATG